jgi:hypothetical protein
LGHQLIPLPWDALGRSPVLDQLIPARVGAYLSLGAAVALACWLADRSRTGEPAQRSSSWHRLWPWVLAVLVLASLFPDISGPVYAVRLSTPSFFEQGNYKRDLRPNEVVLTLPYGMTPLWQATAHMYYRTAGGAFSAPPNYAAFPAIDQMEGLQPFSMTSYAPSIRQLLIAQRVSAVIIQNDAASGPYIDAINTLGLHAKMTHGVLLYHVPASL